MIYKVKFLNMHHHFTKSNLLKKRRLCIFIEIEGKASPSITTPA